MRVFVVFFLMMFVFTVQAEEQSSPDFEPITGDINSRLDRLEKYLDNKALLDMLNVMETLKLDVNNLRGQIEVQTHTLEQLQQKQRDLYTDIDDRLQRLENSNTASTPESVATATAELVENVQPAKTKHKDDDIALQPVPPDPTKAKAEYQRAFKLLKNAQYEQALTAFKQYLVDFPTSDYSDNAQYWLGETNYVMQKYDVAINEYQALLSTYPDSRKVSHALLKIGYSYAELGNAGDAKKAFSAVKKQYPDTTAARLADERLRKLGGSAESST